MTLRIAQFIALVLMAISLVPGGAHLFEMTHKLALSEQEYFIVQRIYAGWALFAIPIFGALLATILVAFLLHRQKAAALILFAGFCALVASTLLSRSR